MVSNNENETATVEVEQVQNAEIKSISEEDFEKAQKVFQLGKKNLLLNKYAESVNNIEEACKVYSAKYGELDPRCAEVYYFFGRALLELARVENTVLGNALNGVPEDTGPIDDSRYGNPDEVAAEEKDEIAEKVIDALCNTEEGENGKTEEEKKEGIETNGEKKSEEEPKKAEQNGEAKEEEPKKESAATEATATDAAAAAATEEKKPETAETNEGEKKEEETSKNGDAAAKTESEEEAKKEGGGGGEEEKNGEGGEEEEEEEGGEENGEENGEEDITKNEGKEADDDISNLQRSWEMFELAKLIYNKNFGDDETFKNKRIAECLLKLGEISIEQEIYEQAVSDIKESIKLQEEQKESERDERMLAESYYQLGLAQQFNNFFTEANESYQKSINILQIRIEKLKGKLLGLADNDTEDGKLEKNTINDEISELETLLPELNSKLEEVNEQGQQSLNYIKEAKECFAAAANAAAAANGQNGEFKASNGAECKDITSLMKSKRKISSSEEISSIKKTRLSGGSNGTTAEEAAAAAPAAESTEENKIEIDEQQPAENGKEEEKPGQEEEKIEVEQKPAEQQAAEEKKSETPAATEEPAKEKVETETAAAATETAKPAEETPAAAAAEETPMAAEEATA